MTKVFELGNSLTVCLETNFARLPHSLDFAGRLKPVSVTAPRVAENLGTPPPRSSEYHLAPPCNYNGKELSPPIAGYCLRATITYMYIWHEMMPTQAS